MTDKDTPPEYAPLNRLGKPMLIGGWILILGLLTWLFGDFERDQHNPNRDYNNSDNLNRIELKANAFGHYLANGEINNISVEFLLDTGATQVSVPESIALKAGMKKGNKHRVSTANGTIMVYQSRIDHLNLMGMHFYDVPASINPYMDGEILLGMSVMRHLDIQQSQGFLTLTKR